MNTTSSTSSQDAVGAPHPEEDEPTKGHEPGQDQPKSRERRPLFRQCEVTCPVCGVTRVPTLEQIHDGTWLRCPTCDEVEKKAA